jgi:hypothetical protein
MLKVVTALLLTVVGVTLAGCRASADIDPHGATPLVAPQ